MIKRTAIVFWWIGTLIFFAGIVTSAFALSHSINDALILIVMTTTATALFFTFTFILSGSFWRPPSSN